MNKFIQFIKSSSLPILSGVLIGTTYIPFPAWALFFCYTPLFVWANQQSSLKKVFQGAWLTQFILTLIGFHWIAFVAHDFGNFPWSLSILTALLFAAAIHLHIPLVLGLSFYLKSYFKLSSTSFLILCALLLSLIERVWPMIFPWHLGYPLLWMKWPLFQWADVVGFHGLSAFILLINAWVGFVWLHRQVNKKQDKKKIALHLAGIAALLIALNLSGHLRAQPWNKTNDSVQIAMIQANIGNTEKVAAEKGYGYQDQITQEFLDLTSQALQKNKDLDLIIWPETAFPDYPLLPHLSASRMQMIARTFENSKATLLTGAYAFENRLSYNSMYLISSQGRVLAGPYKKSILLAFGEYMPFSEQFPFLLDLFPFIANFGRGPGPTTFSYLRSDQTELKIGLQICYEGLFADFSRGLTSGGSDFIVNVTNDSWFGTPFEPRQHLIMTLARAIENRRPLIRSTNTGISTVILADGTLLEKSPTHEKWVGLENVQFTKSAPMTFYTRFGHYDWLFLLVWALFLCLGDKLKWSRYKA